MRNKRSSKQAWLTWCGAADRQHPCLPVFGESHAKFTNLSQSQPTSSEAWKESVHDTKVKTLISSPLDRWV